MSDRVRVVVIAATVAAGQSRRSRDRRIVAIVTPRARHAARGVTADLIDVDRSVFGHPALHTLIELAQPAIARSTQTQTGQGE